MFRGHGAPKSLSEADRLALMYQFKTPVQLVGGVNFYRANMLWCMAFWSVEVLKEYIFKKVEVNTLMIWGRGDEFAGDQVPVDNAEFFENYEIDYLKDEKAGHWVSADFAEEVNGKILRFVK